MAAALARNILLALTLASGCTAVMEARDTSSGVVDDADGDGIPADEDCDDSDPTVGGPQTWYLDADGDGYGNLDETYPGGACEEPGGPDWSASGPRRATVCISCWGATTCARRTGCPSGYGGWGG